MKKIARKVLFVSVALLMAVAMAVPVLAAQNLDVLFDEDFRGGEHLIRRVKTDGMARFHGDLYTYTDWTHVTRSLMHDLTVDEDVTVADMIRIHVPEGMTLTVAKGATLTVRGKLHIEGTLVNRGTIVIGDSRAYKEEDGVDPYYKSLLINDNGASVTNYGTIDIVRGEFHNEGEATFQNDGDVNITNRDEDLVGLRNSTIMRATLHPGVIVNNGKIHVDAEEGYGIRSEKVAVLENNGEIIIEYGSKNAATIVGNPAIEGLEPIED